MLLLNSFLALLSPLHKKIIKIGLILALLFAPLSVIAQSSGDAPSESAGGNQFFQELNKAASPSFETGDPGENTLTQTVATGIQIFLGFVGIVAVVIVIYAGFLWATAGGNDDKIADAKRMIGQAVMGIIILMIAYALVRFVANAISSDGQFL